MKAPIVEELTENGQNEDKSVNSNITDEKAIVSKKERPKGKSYTLYQHHLKYINDESIKLTTERGVAVNSSEALRVILDRVMEHSK